MNETRRELIEIYGSYPSVNAACDSEAHLDLVRRHDGDPPFFDLCSRVERLADHLHKAVGPYDDAHDQIRSTLRILLATKGTKRRELVRDLALRLFDWSPAQQEYVCDALERIEAWTPYFLSFTDRARSTRAINRVNRNHRYFILEVVPSDFESGPDDENYLALALHQLLVDEGLDGYFWKDYREDSREEIDAKLHGACCDCFVFIQLVQQVMFTDVESNWCHWEFERATGKQKTYMCLIAEPLSADDVDPELGDWFTYVFEHGCPTIAPTMADDRGTIVANCELVTDIANTVKRARDEQLFAAIPE